MIRRNKQKREIFYGVWVVAGCFVLLFLFSGAGFYSFGVFIKPLEEHFGWGRAAISSTISIYLLLQGIAGPFVGQLIDTWGPKKVMTFFAIGTGLCFILVSFTHSLWYLYLSYGLLSVANSGIGFIPVSSVLARWFIRRRGTAIGSAMVGMAAGGLVLAPLSSLISYHFGWRISFVFLGILVWTLSLPIILFVIKGSPAEIGLLPDGGRSENMDISISPDRSDSVTKPAEQEWPIRAALGSKAFRWIVVSFFLAPMAQMGVLQHQVPLIVDSGISQTTAAAALGLTAGFGGAGKICFGRISEFVPVHYVTMLCFVLQAVAVLILLNFRSMGMIWVYVMIFGFGMGGVIVLLPLVVGQFFGLTAFSVIVGTVSLVHAFGSSSGALLSGLIYDHLGSYHYALIFYIVIYLVATLTIFMGGKPKPYRIS
ncbi:MAG: MFS transporter [Pseudomonadota bacterium]